MSVLTQNGIDSIVAAMPEITFSTREAAEYLKVSVNRVLDLIEEGRFPNAYQVGRVWKIPAEDVINFERLPHRGRNKRRWKRKPK